MHINSYFLYFYMCRYPQALLTAEQARRRSFLGVFLGERYILGEMTVLVSSRQYTMCLIISERIQQTRKRKGIQMAAELCPELSSRPDTITMPTIGQYFSRYLL